MEITVTTSQEAKEAAADILYQSGANGLVIEDSLPAFLAADVEDYADLPEESFPLEEVRLVAYLPVDESLAVKIDSIRQSVAALADFDLDPGPAEIALQEVEDTDWGSAWKAFYKPIRLGKNLLIKPTWEDVTTDGRVVLELDPGMAFGTGTHPTTVMCLEILESLIRGGEQVIDVGCGSGILSIACAKLGAAQVQALDYDPMAIKVTTENLALNGVHDRVIARESNLLSEAAGKADLIVANIIARVIVDLIPEVEAHLQPDGTFVASGIIEEKLPAVLQALDDHGYVVIEDRRSGDWVALTCKRR
jgi:ribosomal protein L11 methyltransferase